MFLFLARRLLRRSLWPAVSNIAAVSGNSTVNVTWEAPVTDGGAAVSGYELDGGGGADVRTVSGQFGCLRSFVHWFGWH